MFTRTRASPDEALRDARVPIVLGVTGHRTLGSKTERLADVIAGECRRLAKDYPNSPFLLLSGLAEGADRLVARVALATLPECRLIAVLPMPRADFEADFQTEASRSEFTNLLAQAAAVIEIEAKGDDWRQPGEPRNILYAKAGALIAEHAQVLFALWDNRASRGTGGTADVVGWFRKGYAPQDLSFYQGELSPLDPPEAGLLLSIEPATGKLVRDVAKSPDDRGTKISSLLRLTDVYNRALAKKAKLILATRKPLRPTAPQLKPIGEVYVAADALAVSYAGHVRYADRWMYGFALGAFALFSLVDKSPATAYGYAVVTILMFLIWGVMWWTRLENRFLEYRALAEAMRVLFYWRLAGITRPAWLGYLAKHSGVVHWVRHAVRAIEFQNRAGIEANAPPGPADGLAVARANWIEAQIAFYEGAKTRHTTATTRWNRITAIALAISYAFAAILVIYGWDRGVFLTWEKLVDGTPVLYEDVPFYLQLALGITAAVSIAARSYLTRKADEDLVKHYASALQIFYAARDELAAADKKQADGAVPDWPPQETLKRLGIEALREHGEWLWLRHSRPFDVPN